MVTDQEIASCVESLIRNPDSAAAGGGDVVKRVEEKLGGVDLSHKAAFIRDQIQLLRCPPPEAPHAFYQLPASPHFLLSPFYQMPPGSYPIAFRLPPVTPTGGVQPVLVHPQQRPPPPPAAAAEKPPPGGRSRSRSQPSSANVAQKPPASPYQSTRVPARIKRRRGPGGLTKLCGVSPELQAIVGDAVMPRTEIVKQLWAYIRKNNLQDPNNRRNIICNDELRLVLETDCTDTFKMNRLLLKHITPLEPNKDAAPGSKKLKADAAAEEHESVADSSPIIISEALAGFLGAGGRELLQSEALRLVWDYIKVNQLEDPVNKMILCDSKLQLLFGCANLAASRVSEMLSCHLFDKP